MDFFDEIVGFLIILFVLLFPLLRKILLPKKQAPQKRSLEEEELFDEQEYVVEEEAPLIEAPPLKPPQTDRLVTKDFTFHSDFDDYKTKESVIEERTLETHIDPQFKETVVSKEHFVLTKKQTKKGVSPLDRLANKYSQKQLLIIHSEILRRPKGL